MLLGPVVSGLYSAIGPMLAQFPGGVPRRWKSPRKIRVRRCGTRGYREPPFDVEHVDEGLECAQGSDTGPSCGLYGGSAGGGADKPARSRLRSTPVSTLVCNPPTTPDEVTPSISENTAGTVAATFKLTVVCPSASQQQQGVELVPDNLFPTDK